MTYLHFFRRSLLIENEKPSFKLDKTRRKVSWKLLELFIIVKIYVYLNILKGADPTSTIDIRLGITVRQVVWRSRTDYYETDPTDGPANLYKVLADC